jgi:hypothetical protein
MGRVSVRVSHFTTWHHSNIDTFFSLTISFIQNSEMIEQVDRDVKRTHPDMHFFCGDSSFAKSNQVNL